MCHQQTASDDQVRSSLCQDIGSVLSVLALLLTSGCATCDQIIKDCRSKPRDRQSVIYAGTRYHQREIPLYSSRNRWTMGSELAYSFRWWHYVDLPLSFCADTLLLPYTIPRTAFTRWHNRPTKETKEVQELKALIQEYVTCLDTLYDLKAGKASYVQLHDLDASEEVPQNVNFYRTQLQSCPAYLYKCPAGGKYRVGRRGEEPSCTIHGSLSAARATLQFIYKEKRLPDAKP